MESPFFDPKDRPMDAAPYLDHGWPRMSECSASESVLRGGLLLACAACLSCEAEIGLARGQVLVLIDTDMPIVGQLAEHSELSSAAAIDTIRVDAFAEDGTRYDFLDVVVPDVADWPLSFGVASEGKSHIRLEIRAFKAAFAERGELNDRDTLEPKPDLTIDRVVDLPLPSEGVQRVLIHLAGDCLGVRPDFSSPTDVRTCVDGARPAVPASVGVEKTDKLVHPSVIGTWPAAIEQPCDADDSDERACIEGGFMLLGDDSLDGFLDGALYHVASSPVLPVAMSPFFMDRTEFTVGRLEALLQTGVIIDPLPRVKNDASDSERFCTWGGGDPQMPVNCVTQETARQICAAAGGELPTEARWEFAARGRGQDNSYPWGDTSPRCCTAAVSLQGTTSCGAMGPRAVGTFFGADGCESSDVSRDGIRDLAGNLAELTRDSALPYTHPCWARGSLLHDPVCESTEVESLVSRGASWTSGLAEEASALRRTTVAPLPSTGFRCVYPEQP